jgi:hypothetical protein
MSSSPPNFRRFCPRKSKPSRTCVIFYMIVVFSTERTRPRSRSKLSMTGLHARTSASRSAADVIRGRVHLVSPPVTPSQWLPLRHPIRLINSRLRGSRPAVYVNPSDFSILSLRREGNHRAGIKTEITVAPTPLAKPSSDSGLR